MRPSWKQCKIQEIKCYFEVKGNHAVLFEHENTNTECDIICVYLRLSHTSYFLYYTHLKYIHKKKKDERCNG
jgi:hypothetical protein